MMQSNNVHDCYIGNIVTMGGGIDDVHLDKAASSERLGREPHTFPEASLMPSATAAKTAITTKLYTSELSGAMQIAYSTTAPCV